MTNQEILEKAISKAIADGWKDGKAELELVKGAWHVKSGNGSRDAMMEDFLSYFWLNRTYQSVIFNHDFAKALWGETDEYIALKHQETGEASFFVPIKRWRNRLQQMVIADDPIKYLGENL